MTIISLLSGEVVKHMDVTVGMDVQDLLVELVRELTQIQEINLLQFRAVPSLAERSGETGSAFRLKLEILSDGSLRDLWIPPHEIVLVSALNAAWIPRDLLKEAVWHEDLSRYALRTPVRREEFSVSAIEEVRTKRPECILAISSAVTLTSGRRRHLPLMDFQCPAVDEHLPSVIEALRGIGEKAGAIVLSGKSYHYYGFRLLTPKGWHGFLGKCLLLSPITDTRYVGHRLIDGECALRIVEGKKQPDQPKVIAVL